MSEWETDAFQQVDCGGEIKICVYSKQVASNLMKTPLQQSLSSSSYLLCQDVPQQTKPVNRKRGGGAGEGGAGEQVGGMNSLLFTHPVSVVECALNFMEVVKPIITGSIPMRYIYI